MGDVGAQGSPQAGRIGRNAHDTKVRGTDKVVRFRAEERSPEAKADRCAPVVLVDVAEPAASRRAVHRAVVLGVEIMEHADGEEYDESDDRGLFHASEIIPRPCPQKQETSGLTAAAARYDPFFHYGFC